MRWVLLGFAALAATPVMADPVFDMCMKPGKYGPEQCDCVVTALQNEVSPADYALYSAVAGRYLQGLSGGLSRSDAWDAGVQAEAQARQATYAGLLGTTNEVGRRHREIAGRCGG